MNNNNVIWQKILEYPKSYELQLSKYPDKGTKRI